MRFFFWLTARGVIGAAVKRNFLDSSYFVRKGPDQAKYSLMHDLGHCVNV